MIKSTYKNLFTFLLGIILSIANIACTKATKSNFGMPQPTDTTQTPPADSLPALIAGKGFLALGDSYTIGQSVQPGDRFPAQTVTILRLDNITIGDPQYIATTGWTTINLADAIEQQNPQGPFEAVTLLIGVNDQYQQLDTGGYRIRFAQLLQKAIQLTGNRTTRVFVLSIPDYSVTPFGGGSLTIRQQIDEFNAINKQITMAANVAYINITDISRLAANDPSLIASDGLHPSARQYGLWVGALAPVMEKALK